jgi:EEF1A lysine methyltransferase 4
MITPASHEFWEEFYEKNELGYEWYISYVDCVHIFSSIISLDTKQILQIGCGNSFLSEHLIVDYSWVHVTNIDVCENVIQQMNERLKEMVWMPKSNKAKKKENKEKSKEEDNRLKYLVMDACAMQYENDAFDFVIDKVFCVCLSFLLLLLLLLVVFVLLVCLLFGVLVVFSLFACLFVCSVGLLY